MRVYKKKIDTVCDFSHNFTSKEAGHTVISIRSSRRYDHILIALAKKNLGPVLPERLLEPIDFLICDM